VRASARIADLQLPDFWRCAWVSAAARDVWAPRLAQLREDAAARALAAAEAQIVPVVALAVAPDRVFDLRRETARRGLSVLRVYAALPHGVVPVAVPSRYATSRAAPELLLVGAAAATAEARAALLAGDGERARECLSVPRCCRAFHAREAVNWCSAWWPAASAAAGGDGDGAIIIRPAAPPAVPLLDDLRVGGLWHWPCSLDCRETARLDAALASLAEPELAAWLGSIQRWPVEWSALHGIAELKTPVVRVARAGDSLAAKLVVQLSGAAGDVEAAAAGVRFPFVVRASKRRVSGRAPP
jgi:hypothetical protein